MEYTKQAEEFASVPREYDIPNEFPESKTRKKKKKRSGIAAALLAGTMALILSFDYLLPFTSTGGHQQAPAPGLSGEEVRLECAPPLALAAVALMDGDYVSSAMCMMEAFQISLAEQEEEQLDVLQLAYQDDQICYFSGEDLRDGSGVYFWIDGIWQGTRNDETGETYDYFNIEACAFFVQQREAGLREFRAVRIELSFDTSQIGEISYGNGHYLQTVMDPAWNAETASLEHFTINPDDGYAPEENLIGNYEVALWERVVGPLQEGNFCGEVQWWKDDVTLSADKTKFEYPDISLGDYYRLLLDEQGKTLAYEMGLADLTGYEYYSDEYVDRLIDIQNDPSIPGAISMDDNGTIALYIKKVDPELSGINYHGSDLLGHAWFPVIDTTFQKWMDFEEKIG